MRFSRYTVGRSPTPTLLRTTGGYRKCPDSSRDMSQLGLKNLGPKTISRSRALSLAAPGPRSGLGYRIARATTGLARTSSCKRPVTCNATRLATPAFCKPASIRGPLQKSRANGKSCNRAIVHHNILTSRYLTPRYLIDRSTIPFSQNTNTRSCSGCAGNEIRFCNFRGITYLSSTSGMTLSRSFPMGR